MEKSQRQRRAARVIRRLHLLPTALLLGAAPLMPDGRLSEGSADSTPAPWGSSPLPSLRALSVGEHL